MAKWRRRAILALVLSAGAIQAQAQTPAAPLTPESFDWRQALVVEGSEAVYRFELPEGVYRSARRRDLGDLRVFNGAGEVVPHALARYESPLPRTVSTTPLTAFPLHGDSGAQAATISAIAAIEVAVRQRPDGTLVSTRIDPAKARPQGVTGYVFDASTLPRPASALLLRWQPQPEGTVLPVEVAASDDLQSWRPVSAGAQLVDLRVGGQQLGRNRIELGGHSGRYLRLIWPRDRQPIVLTGVEAETAEIAIQPTPLRWSPAEALRVGEQPGEFLFETGGLPATALHLSLPEVNTVTPLRVFHRDGDREPWRAAIDTIAYRLLRQGQEALAPPLPMNGVDRHWRLVFDQRGGGIGQGMPIVSLGWQPSQAVFVARGSGPFLLAYGNDKAPPLDFAPATLIPGYRAEGLPQLPIAHVGEPVRNAPVHAAAAPQVAVPWRSIGLWAVLIVGVLLLGGMVWRLLGQMGGGNRG